jgi:hypothetical protein
MTPEPATAARAADGASSAMKTAQSAENGTKVRGRKENFMGLSDGKVP